MVERRSPHLSEGPGIIKGPYTTEARFRVVEKESRLVYQKALVKHPDRLSILQSLPTGEMAHLGHKLRPDTIRIIEGFGGVEAHIEEYINAGKQAYAGIPVLLDILHVWGSEERVHPKALRLLLFHSGVRTLQEIREYEHKRREKIWLLTQHEGVDGAAGGIVFATVQERSTYDDYLELIGFVRTDCDLPLQVTPEERLRKKEIGASEVLRRIARVEIGHHGIFLDLLTILAKYFPDATAAKIHEVLATFSMPAMDLLPNKLPS